MTIAYRFIFALFAALLPTAGFAAEGSILSFADHPAAVIALVLFIGAYVLVMLEEFTDLSKSKPMVVAAGLIWLLVAIMSLEEGLSVQMAAVVRHNILEYAELFLFLLVAMTYVITLQERNVFESLRAWLVRKGYSFKQLFWITGILGFIISPVADNLTTALLMCAVILAVGADNPRFVVLSCINIVVAVNAGGAFSPFGDITTLMVWQKGALAFTDFFAIFAPSVVSFIVPAAIMHFAVPNAHPAPSQEVIKMKIGARRIVMLFFLTIATAVTFHHYLNLPPVIGMMTGFGYLQIFAFYLKKREIKLGLHGDCEPFDIFSKIQNIEWDTLLFFYGVILCVGGLAALGYLHFASDFLYNQLGSNLSAAHSATPANLLVGLSSAFIDNIPVMYAVLTMNPTMSEGQWLLVTLTAGIGGSLLSIGSAAGVALMGQAKGKYTFFSHLKWTWAIALGFVAGVLCHFWINSSLF